MILVVGGFSAGKRTFVAQTLGYEAHQMSPEQDDAPVFWGLEQWRPLPRLEWLMTKEVVICAEVGCGLVPVEPEERHHREQVGRLCCQLAQQATAVYRICCGLSVRLK